MTIPTLPAFWDMNYTTKEGSLTPEAHLHNDQTFQVLDSGVGLINAAIASSIANNTVSYDGAKIAPKTTAEITNLQPNADPGTIWFNTDIGKLQVKISSGVVQTITSA